MRGSTHRIPAILRSSVSLALAGLMVVGAGATETPKGGAAAATGALSITTDPINAEVFVDGRPAGQTPTNLASVAAGEHRVRIVKNGYLENARVVTVAPGAPTVVNVKLTKSSAATVSEPAGQVSSTGGGGGGSKKWLWIGLAGAGAAVAIVALMPKNDPPVPGTITVSPTATGMAGVTNFTIRSTGASDPDSDPLTFSWRFSDNTTATGESVTKTFASAGTFQATLTVSDGKLTADAPPVSITVGPNLTATWAGGSITMPNAAGALTIPCTIALALTQSGTTLSGTMPFSVCTTGSLNLNSGSVSVLTHPAGVTTATGAFTWTTGNTQFANLVISFSGTTNTAGTSMSGNVTLSQTSTNFSATSATTFTRQ